MRCYFDQALLLKIKETKNRKILIKMSAILLLAPWVRVELIVYIYLSLYFPFKIFMMILHF
jgi:ABC-type tungstate transport system substrate-binding protein